MNRFVRLLATVVCFGLVATFAGPAPGSAMGSPCHGCAETCMDAERWCQVFCGMPANDVCVLDTFNFCEGTPFIWVVGCGAPN